MKYTKYRNLDGTPYKKGDTGPIQVCRDFLDEDFVKKNYNGNSFAAMVDYVGSFKFDAY